MLHEPPLRALVGAIRELEAPKAIDANIGSFLQRFGVRGADLGAMSSELSASRMLVYRSLVHNRFRSAVEVSIPGVVRLLGSARLERDVAQFLDERASASAYLRDVASEFVAWARPAWRADLTVPACVAELARHELLTFELAAAEQGECPAFARAIDIDKPLVFRGPVRIVRYEYPVHRIAEVPDDQKTDVEAEPVALLAYRDGGHMVRFLELSPAAAAILDGLLTGTTPLRVAIAEGCERVGIAVDDAVLGGTAELLADLAERGVLLGAAMPA